MATTWTPQPRSTVSTTLTQGSPIGLLLVLTYATTTTTPGQVWTNITKNTTTWTNQTKN
jgi:hypothetical protein